MHAPFYNGLPNMYQSVLPCSPSPGLGSLFKGVSAQVKTFELIVPCVLCFLSFKAPFLVVITNELLALHYDPSFLNLCRNKEILMPDTAPKYFLVLFN